MERTGPMDQLALVNVQSRPIARFSMNLIRRRPVLSGTIPITVMRQMLPMTLNLISNLFPGTQYCDGMRGALVVYDPEDPTRRCMTVKPIDTNWNLTSTS